MLAACFKVWSPAGSGQALSEALRQPTESLALSLLLMLKTSPNYD